MDIMCIRKNCSYARIKNHPMCEDCMWNDRNDIYEDRNIYMFQEYKTPEYYEKLINSKKSSLAEIGQEIDKVFNENLIKYNWNTITSVVRNNDKTIKYLDFFSLKYMENVIKEINKASDEKLITYSWVDIVSFFRELDDLYKEKRKMEKGKIINDHRKYEPMY